ncbi:MAG: hypothetical protein WA913_07965 [Pricia sp.]
MKNIIVTLFFILFAATGLSAQDIFLQDENQSVEEKSRVLTEAYQPELVMTGTQTRLFERKLGEFMLRAEEIKAMDASTEERLRLLGELSEQETEEMANILTRPQIKKYVKVKSELQPIAMVVDSVNTNEQ